MKTGITYLFAFILLLSSCSLFQKTPEASQSRTNTSKTRTSNNSRNNNSAANNTRNNNSRTNNNSTANNTRNNNNNTRTNPNNSSNNSSFANRNLNLLPDENEMIQEINLMRTSPQEYMQYVKEYMQDIRMDSDLSQAFKDNEIAAARELISEMIRMRPVNELRPHQGLYEAAVKHGDDVKSMGELDHVGSDGSFPWDRIANIAKLEEGNENLVGGAKTVREAVIILLVDSGVAGRGHRLALMDPEWEYVACHQLGVIDGLENCWIQVFGKGGKAAPFSNNYNSTASRNNGSNVPQRYNGNNTQNQNSNSGNASANANMSLDEETMIKEINLMRSNPRAYVKHVRQYIEDFKRAGWDQVTVRDEEQSANELIRELQRRLPLSILKPHPELYQVAKMHGDDLRRIGQVQHRGSDGSQPYERITKNTNLSDGNENLVGGADNVRESVIMLLVDSGIPNRGHRKTLLDPKWNYVACYKVGNIGNMPNSWVQLFGKGSSNAATNSNTNRNTNTNSNSGRNANTNTNSNKNNRTTSSPSDFSFMSAEEQAMIKEINLMRDDPRGYVKYVRQYVEDFKRAGWDQATTRDEVATADELIKELQRRLPLSTLKPHSDLHKVAKKHGEDLKRIGKVQHRGSDGSQPWDRVTKNTNLSDGNENLVGGGTSVRESVIMLLVDSGIPNRGHRRTLLDPRWDYVACYKAGNIGGMPDSWVQVFGKK